MKAMYLKRLEKLAVHLEKGKLGHEVFDFSVYNISDSRAIMPEGMCGTRGCALGECPILFPKHWKFGSLGFPTLRHGRLREMDTTLAAGNFFGIGDRDVQNLFIPGKATVNGWYGSMVLSRNATRKEVAKNIRDFIKWKESEGIPCDV